MTHAQAARALVFFSIPLLICPQEARGNPLLSWSRIPIFAQFIADGTRLRSYIVPVHAHVTLRKLIVLHVLLNGTIKYTQPDEVALTLPHVSQQQRNVFAKLSTPRTWPENYNLQVTGPTIVDGHAHYIIHGLPKNPNDAIAFLSADVSDETAAQIRVQWHLSGSGTITMLIDTARIAGYVLPVRQRTDIHVPGNNVHADMRYGEYVLNASAENVSG
jgi:hypothetical protein